MHAYFVSKEMIEITFEISIAICHSQNQSQNSLRLTIFWWECLKKFRIGQRLQEFSLPLVQCCAKLKVIADSVGQEWQSKLATLNKGKRGEGGVNVTVLYDCGYFPFPIPPFDISWSSWKQKAKITLQMSLRNQGKPL